MLSTAMTGMQATAGTLPTGGDVKAGDAAIRHVDKNRMVIDQSSQQAVIDWNTFNVGKSDSVHFNQPDVSSSTLNRVLSSTPSTIAGTVTGTGQVFLVNPNGILITESGVIDTNSFTASSLNIRNADFMNGKFEFTKDVNANGMVENRGKITVNDGGFAALVGEAIKNDGVINAHLGKVAFGAGEKVVLTMGDSALLQVVVSTSDLAKLRDSNGNTISDVIDHSGSIIADGGMVQITAKSAGDLLRQNVRISGDIQARTVKDVGGKIIIGGADTLTTESTAKLDVSGSVLGDALAELKSNGGTITIDGINEIALAGQFLAAGMNDGGKITVVAGAKGLTSTATFSADGTHGVGGRIGITADGGTLKVTEGDISATGQDRGGLIRVGGEFQGGRFDANTSSLNDHQQKSFVKRWGRMVSLGSALNTTVSRKVLVNASAGTGSGGTVVLWSDKHTEQRGRITANGGTRGGSVEISGKNTLDYDLHQVNLKNGELLLDPKNLTIHAGADVAEDAAGLEKKQASAIASTLNAGTNVTLAASNDIIVNAGIYAGTGSGDLTLRAGRSLDINNYIITNGGLNLIANSSDFSNAGMTASDRDDGVAKIDADSNLYSLKDILSITMEDGVSGATDAKRYSGEITFKDKTILSGQKISIRHLGTKFKSSDATSRSHVDLGEITINVNGGKDLPNNTNRVTFELSADSVDYDSDWKFESLSSLDDLVSKQTRALIWVKSVNDFNVKDVKSKGVAAKPGWFHNVGFGYSHDGSQFKESTAFADGGILFKEGFGTADASKRKFTTSKAKSKVYDGTATMSTASWTNSDVRLNGTTLTGTSNALIDVGGGLKVKDGSLTNAEKNAGKTIKVTVDNGATGGRYVGNDGKANANVGSKAQFTGAKVTLTFHGKAVKVKNFDFNNLTLNSTVTTSANQITKRTLTPTLTTVSREYDGTKALTYNNVSWSGMTMALALGGEIPKATANSFTATLTTKDAGNAKAVTYSGGTLTDNGKFKAANYQIGTVKGKSAAGVANKEIITPRELKVALGFNSGKTYDGTKATSTPTVFSATMKVSVLRRGGLLASETPATSSGSGGNAVARHTGKFKAETSSADAGTYGLDGYRGYPSFQYSNDDFTLVDNPSGNFKASNYKYVADDKSSDLRYTINPAPLTAKITAKDKVYDGTADLTYNTLTNGDWTGLVSTETVVGTGAFTVTTAGNVKDATGAAGVGYTASKTGFTLGDGTGSNKFKKSNYTLGNPTLKNTAHKVKITPKEITVTAQAQNRVYDGTSTFTSQVVPGNEVLAGERNDFKYTGNIGISVNNGKKDVGEYTVSVTSTGGFALADGDGGKFKAKNYKLKSGGVTSVGKVRITPRTITPTLTTVSRAYDGTRTLTYSGVTWAGLITGANAETPKASGFTATLTTADAGNSKAVTYGGGTLADDGDFKAANYKLGTVAGKSAAGVAGKEIITKRTITPTLTTVSRAYDGTKALTYSAVAWTNKVSGETPKATANSFTATADSKDAGTQTVKYSGGTLATNGAFKPSNYQIGTVAGKSAAGAVGKEIITKRTITPTLTTVSRAYDGSRTLTYSAVTWANKVSGETPQATANSFTATADSKDAGTQTVKYSGGTLEDNNAFKKANYRIGTVAGESAAGVAGKEIITPRTITPTLTTVSRAYDGTTTLTYNGVTWANTLSGETPKATANSFTATLTTKDAGNAKAVTYSGGTLEDNSAFKKANYQIGTVAGKSAAGKANQEIISKRAITPTLKTVSRAYDGTKTLAYTVLGWTGTLASETPKASGFTATMSTADAGNSKAVSYSGGTLADDGTFKAANYRIASVSGRSAAGTPGKEIITPATLTVKLTTNSRAYDGTTKLTYKTLSAADFGGLVTGTDGTNKEIPGGLTGGLSQDSGKFKAETTTADAGVDKAVTYGLGSWWSELPSTGGNGFKKANYQISNSGVTGVGSTGKASKETISKKNLTAILSLQNKVYDGKKTLSYATLDSKNDWSGLVSGEVPGVGTGTFKAEANSADAGSYSWSAVSSRSTVTLGQGTYALANGASGNKFKASNYKIAGFIGNSPKITKAQLKVSLTTNSRAYDGSKALTFTPMWGGLKNGETVAYDGQFTATTASKDVKYNSAGTAVIAQGVTYGTAAKDGKAFALKAGSGSNKFKPSNYVFDKASDISGKGQSGLGNKEKITPRALKVTLNTNSKTYDGSNKLTYKALTKASFDDLVSGETPGGLASSGGLSQASGKFKAQTADANAGVDKAVTYGVGNYKLSDGADGKFKAKNYELSQVVGKGSTNKAGKETIAKRTLTVKTQAEDRNTDGTTAVTFTTTVSGYLGSQSDGITESKLKATLQGSAAGTQKINWTGNDDGLLKSAGGNGFLGRNYTITFDLDTDAVLTALTQTVSENLDQASIRGDTGLGNTGLNADLGDTGLETPEDSGLGTVDTAIQEPLQRDTDFDVGFNFDVASPQLFGDLFSALFNTAPTEQTLVSTEQPLTFTSITLPPLNQLLVTATDTVADTSTGTEGTGDTEETGTSEGEGTGSTSTVQQQPAQQQVAQVQPATRTSASIDTSGTGEGTSGTSTRTTSKITADAETKVRTTPGGKVTFLTPKRQTNTGTSTRGNAKATTSSSTYQQRLAESYKNYARATGNPLDEEDE